MAAFRSLFWLASCGGVGFVLMKVLAKDDNSQLPVDYSDSRNAALKKRQAIVDHLRRAAEEKEPMYRQTKEQIDALRDEHYKKKP